MRQRLRDLSSNTIQSALQPFSGYFKRTIDERRRLIRGYLAAKANVPNTATDTAGVTTATSTSPSVPVDIDALLDGNLTASMADHMVENCIGTIGIPIGIAPTFIVDGVHYLVPMAVEEPSVIAAASGAAKIIAESGYGFNTLTTENLMDAQIQVVQVSDCDAAIKLIADHKTSLVTIANTLCPSMVKRGGGVMDVNAAIRSPPSRPPYIVVFIRVDVCNSMGANVVNTIAEGMTQPILTLLQPTQPNVRAGLRILTNLCINRTAQSSFALPLTSLGWKGVSGVEVANRIIDAYHFACDDPYRAVTNNKGIMNGCDSVAIATGQDWRAIEAAAHAFAANAHLDGAAPRSYGPLAHYYIESRTLADGTVNDCLVGSIKIPISVGTVGGAVTSHPVYKASLAILGQPSARTLASIIVSVGLAQNFAAIRALAVEGIQKGHMALHAKNIAVAAGASENLVSEVSEYIVAANRLNKATAEEYLAARHALTTAPTSLPPSSLFIDVPLSNGNDHVRRHILWLSNSSVGTVRFFLTVDGRAHPIQEELFGPDRGIDWIKTAVGNETDLRKAEYIVLDTVLSALTASLLHHDSTRSTVNAIAESTDSKPASGDSDDVMYVIGVPLLWAVSKAVTEASHHVQETTTQSNSLSGPQRLQSLIDTTSRENSPVDATHRNGQTTNI